MTQPGGTEDLGPDSQEKLWVDRFVLSVVDGPDKGALAMSPGDRMTIGTDRSCDFALGDRSMSRFHCEITIGPEGARVRDMDSTNGTRVDGVRVAAAWLKRGSRLALGRNTLVFEMAGERLGMALHPAERFGDLVGRSPAMRAVFARLARASQSGVTVLLCGETGTGKDLAAEAIHAEGPRAAGPFVVVDCASAAGGVLASELFGHARGAFTDATRERVGAIESAGGGTLFLDEIGELPLELQPLLLRAIEAREVQRIGETRRRPVDVRVVAATNRDLRRAVNAGRFRADLYYRLAVLTIELPPLRERKEDLPLLVERFGAAGRAPLDALARRDWPGNVRELRNHLESLSVGEPPDGEVGRPGASQPMRIAREQWLRWFEREYVQDLLRRHGPNVVAAAKAAGVDRAYLYRIIKRSGLR